MNEAKKARIKEKRKWRVRGLTSKTKSGTIPVIRIRWMMRPVVKSPATTGDPLATAFKALDQEIAQRATK